MPPPRPKRAWSFPWPALFLGLGVLYGLFCIHEVLIPFVLSFALAYLVDPVIYHFEARALRRGHIVLALYAVIAAGIAVLASVLLPDIGSELGQLQSSAPRYVESVRETLLSLQTDLAGRLPFGQHIVERFNLKMYNPIMEKLPLLPTYILGLFPLLSLLFLVPFITFFMLMDSNAFFRKAIQGCPSRHVEQALHIISEVDSALGNYLRGIMITAGVIAAASYIGLWSLGVDYALAVAALSGVSSFIPYLGAILGALVGGLVAFFQFHNVWAPLKVVALFCGIRVADEAIVQPLISRHTMHLHPLIFLLSLMVGGKVFGFIGLLFAVPAACVLKAVVGVAYDYYTSQTQSVPPQTPDGLEIPYV